MATVSRLFDDYSAASQAVRNVEAAGISHGDISIVSNNSDNWYTGTGTGTDGMTRRVDRDGDGVDDRAEGAGAGAGIGAALGGAAGLLAGLGLMAIPGIGPVVAAGWLAATAAGAVAGGAAGGMIGALTQSGVSEDDAHVYAEGVRRGGTLVSVRVADADRARIESVLGSSSVDTRQRAEAYRAQGWNRFDPAAQPYSADQARAERELYRRP